MKNKMVITLFFMFIALFSASSIVYADSIDIYCENQQMEINACIKQLAVERKDIALCDRITDESLKGNCLGAFASEKNDIELCKKISKDIRGFDNRYRCFMKFVKSKDNITICEELIKDEAYKDDCYSAILDEDRSDAALCGKFSSDKKRVNCYTKVAKHVDDPELCENILAEKNAKRKSQCKYCDDKGIDYEGIYGECKRYFFMKTITNMCRDYTKNMETDIRWHTKKQMVFLGEHSVKDKFWVTFKRGNAKGNMEDMTAEFDLTDGVTGGSIAALHIGQFAVLPELDTGIQVLNVYTKEEGNDNNKEEIPYADLCIFRPSTKEAKEENKEETEKKEDKEEKPKEETKEKETINKAEEKKTEEENITEKNKEKPKEETEKKSKIVKLKKGGIFYRMVMFFKGIF